MTGPRDGYDDTVAAIRDNTDMLDAATRLWAARDDTRPQPEVRRAANTATDAIDAMLQALHAIRARLITEIRASDDAAAARADALLARFRETT
jgi:hypothetical protein